MSDTEVTVKSPNEMEIGWQQNIARQIYYGLGQHVSIQRLIKWNNGLNEQQLMKSHGKVDLMGDVSWFLEQRYKWRNDIDGLSYHVSQQAFVEGMLDKHGLNKCTTNSSWKASTGFASIPDPIINTRNGLQVIKSIQLQSITRTFGRNKICSQISQYNIISQIVV